MTETGSGVATAPRADIHPGHPELGAVTVTTERRHPSGPGSGEYPSGHRRTAIPATCQLEGGPVDVTNLVVSKRAGTIVLDPRSPARA